MADIKKLAPIIFKWEGGFVNDPADAGGATNKGVTVATWKRVGYDKDGDSDIDADDVKLLTRADAMRVLRIYWNRWKADCIVNQSVANILVDWVWGSGKWGIVIPQRILGVAQDGIVGTKTLAAINGANQRDLFTRLWNRRKKFFEDITANSIAAYERKIGRKATEAELLKHTNKRFLKGWLNRLNDFKFEE